MKKKETKFRAWDKIEKRMIYSDDMEFSASEDMDHDLYELSVFFGWISGENSKDNYELMQYTGLLDKSGKEIYEGDLISKENGEIIFEVIFDDKDAAWAAVRITEEDGVPPMVPDEWYLYNAIKYYEVIGNIFKNSELLKK